MRLPEAAHAEWTNQIIPSLRVTHPFRLQVGDSGTPSLSATQNFQVTVTQPVHPTLSAPTLNGGTSSRPISGDARPDYEIQASSNLADGTVIWDTNSATPPFYFADPNATNFGLRFYRVQLGP